MNRKCPFLQRLLFPASLLGTLSAPLHAALVVAEPAPLYWTATVPGRIETAFSDGSGFQVVETGNLLTPEGLAVDGRHIYLAETIQDGMVLRFNLDGSGRTELVRGRSLMRGLTVAGGRVYWGELGAIMSSDLLGNDVTELSTGFAVDQPGGVAVNATHVYWTEGDSDPGPGVFRASLDGSGFELLAVTNIPTGIALSDLYVFWADYSSRSIYRSDLEGGNTVRLHFNLGRPIGVAVVGNLIYWTDVANGTISRSDFDGNGVEVVLSGLSNPSLLATQIPEPLLPSLAFCSGLLFLVRRSRR